MFFHHRRIHDWTKADPQRLRRAYRNKNQSLSIKDKEFFVLIGPSGSGKTTLLKLINRLIDPTEGDVLLNGKSVMDYPLRELRLNTGYVLQQIALFPNLTVTENIELVPVMKNGQSKSGKNKLHSCYPKSVLIRKYMHTVTLMNYPAENSRGSASSVLSSASRKFFLWTSHSAH